MGNTVNWAGFITLHRKLLNWKWYSDPVTKAVFIHLLISANWKEEEFNGVRIRRGELVETMKHISTKNGITLAQCRTALRHLLSTKEITIQRAGKYNIIRINKYEKYQFDTKNSTMLTQSSHDGQHNNDTINRTELINIEESARAKEGAGEETPGPDDYETWFYGS